MKSSGLKRGLIGLIVIACLLGLTILAQAASLERKTVYGRSPIRVKFYDGHIDGNARIEIEARGYSTSTESENFGITIQDQSPGGDVEKEEVMWVTSGNRSCKEIPIRYYLNANYAGTGYVEVIAGSDTLDLYVKFAFDGSSVRFGESYDPQAHGSSPPPRLDGQPGPNSRDAETLERPRPYSGFHHNRYGIHNIS